MYRSLFVYVYIFITLSVLIDCVRKGGNEIKVDIKFDHRFVPQSELSSDEDEDILIKDEHQKHRQKVIENFVPILFKHNDSVPDAFCEVMFRVRKRINRRNVQSYKNETFGDNGNTLRVNDTFNPPIVAYLELSSKYYTTLMIDVDAPHVKRPIYRSWLNWLVGNVPGRNFSDGETIAEYVGPYPPKLSGLHRFVVLVYQHDNKIDFRENIIAKYNFYDRQNFSNFEFEKKYNIGEATFMNYFCVKYDRFVPTLFKNFPLLS
ncbi:protein D1-like [Lycorma delicatula]|uniref:protein D1-like n=1 Tax=Lycorma delicatula TaxID=130591 RepID=UPI003F51A5D3